MYWQDILARVSAVHSRLQVCWPCAGATAAPQFVVDFSIHGERGKVDGKEQGSYGPAAREALQPQAWQRLPDRKTQGRVFRIQAWAPEEHGEETIGGLFADIYEGVHELTVVEKIWSIIIDVIAIVAEIFTIDENELMEQIIRDNRRFKAMQLIAQTA